LRYLITGAAGFIGYHVTDRLLSRGDPVVGIDDLNPYYDVRLKRARLSLLAERAGFTFRQLGLGDRAGMADLFATIAPEVVIHLAAQAGVRYSLTNPQAFVDANLDGMLQVLEGCRTAAVRHLVFASSSSVYGDNTPMPYREDQGTTHPVSLYAATKIAGEAMAYSYSHLFGVPTTSLRFFTVYGPWGRPDMAYYQFTRDILAGRPIRLFNHGRMVRDFTYIDDVVEGLVRVTDLPPGAGAMEQSAQASPGTSQAPWRVVNIGAGQPMHLGRFIDLLEEALGRRAQRDCVAMQPGDLPATWADVSALEQLTGFRPTIPPEIGIPRFVEWYRSYHQDDRAE
jgi:UDP-glucuronate 4-epimerase